MIYYTNEGKTYAVVGTTDGNISSASDVVIVNFKANTQTYFTAPAGGYVLVSDNAAIITPVFKLAPAALVGQSGAGADSGGSSGYPGWVGYIEYDDETEEAIAADYSGLEMGGQIPNSLMFHKINFRGDWKGSIGKFTDGRFMFENCSKLTSFNSDLSSLTIGTGMFNGCSNLTSFTSDLSSLTEGGSMFTGCSNLLAFTSDLSSLTNGESMFNNCKLDTTSVERILTTIPEYSDGSSHKLRMTIQAGEAAEKFGELTGTIPTTSQTNVNFKGWTITVNTKN